MSNSYFNSNPEAVQSITVTQNSITVEESDASFRQEYKVFPSADIKLAGTTYYMLLDYYPISDGSVIMHYNGVGGQIQGTHYNVSGNIVTLLFDPDTGATFFFTYFTYDAAGATSDNDIPVGVQMAFSGSTIPSGWCLADGSTEYAKASYAALFAWCTANSMLFAVQPVDTTKFIILEQTAEMYDGAATVIVPALIKA